jgi:L-seryl-tRNA(Ser) seleniumtransferase
VTSPRIIPSVEQIRQRPDVRAIEAEYGRDAVLDAIRDEAARLRDALAPGQAAPASLPDTPDAAAAWIAGALPARLAHDWTASLRPVINATGVILHTNLGRAPLADAALARVTAVAAGYCNLEYDLAEGGRGRRDVHAERLLTRLTGAEAAVVVNNNAAATLLLLAALARGREVIISRGELVEIGGGFRVPEIMAQSGAILREVGTTNRTRAADYAAAISDRTALILRVHPSNFRIDGFTERPDAADLVAIARRHGILVGEDLGGGNLAHTRAANGSPALADEPTVQASIATGYDVVCFSGDKLLGGPQAGILLGRRATVDILRRHPLMRAFRADKMTYAALEGTLVEHGTGRSTRTVPVSAMLAATLEDLQARATRLVASLPPPGGLTARVVTGVSTTGGGSAPGSALPTALVELRLAGATPEALERRLRALSTPVVARIERDRVVLDLRTVLPGQDDALAALIKELD